MYRSTIVTKNETEIFRELNEDALLIAYMGIYICLRLLVERRINIIQSVLIKP